MFAEIIINSNAKALNKIFDYIVPKEIENTIRVGSRVFVPFGKGNGKVEDGFVIKLKNKSEFANKEIIRIDEIESISVDKIELSQLMAYKYFCNISDCIKLMIPPGTGNKNSNKRMKSKKGNFVYLNNDIDLNNIKNENHKRVLFFLEQNDGLYIGDVEQIADVSRAVLKTMEKNGYIYIREEKIDRNPLGNKIVNRDAPKKLNLEQQNCYNTIAKDILTQVLSSKNIFWDYYNKLTNDDDENNIDVGFTKNSDNTINFIYKENYYLNKPISELENILIYENHEDSNLY